MTRRLFDNVISPRRWKKVRVCKQCGHLRDLHFINSAGDVTCTAFYRTNPSKSSIMSKCDCHDSVHRPRYLSTASEYMEIADES